MRRRQITKLAVSVMLILAMVTVPFFTGYSSHADPLSVDEQTVTAETAAPDSTEQPVDSAEITNPDDTAYATDITEQGSLPEEGTEALEPAASRTEYVWEDETIKVTAVLTDAAAVPDDAELVVKPVSKGSEEYNYNAYMEALNDTGDRVYSEENTLLYDIAFIKDGVEIEPESGTVSVTFDFLNSQLSESIGAESASDINVVHLPIEETVRDQFDSTADATMISAGDISADALSAEGNALTVDLANEAVSFNTTSFSVFAFIVETTASVQQSPKMAAATSSNLQDFLVSAEINLPEGGAVQGSKYTVDLTFKETPELQFPNGAGDIMTYDLPDGLKDAEGDEGTFKVWLNDGGVVYEIPNNHFIVVDNVLQVTFNTSDPNFERLTAAANLSFNIAFEAELDVENKEVIFDDGITVDYDINEEHSLKAEKSGKFDKAKDVVNYTVKITSTGYNEYIYFQDIIPTAEYLTGISALTFKSNQRTLGEGDYWYSGTESYNGTFTGGFRKMLDGEVITITYSVNIDPTKIPTNDDGKVIIEGGLGNSFTVRTQDQEAEDGADESTVIDYTPGISKGRPKAIGDGNTLEWTITANADVKVSMAGRTIKDTIRQNARQYMTFDETDLLIKVYDRTGTQVDEIIKSWNSLTHDDEYSWAYTVPSSDVQPYKYVITYTTRVDNSSLYTDVSVYNDVEVTGGGKSNNRGIIGPPTPEDRLTVAKEAEGVDLENGVIKWHITVNVPKNGLDTAWVRELYPHTKINGTELYEPVDESSIRMEGLLEGESYTFSDNGKGTATITFKKNGSNGLLPSGTGSRRVINIYLSTTINQTWLQESGGNLAIADHENSISVDGLPAKDSVTVQEPSLKKSVKSAGSRTVDGALLPVYRYEVLLSHVTEVDNVIKDSFDTSILEPYTPDGAEDAWYVYGIRMADGKAVETKGENQFTYRETSYGMEISTNADSLPRYDGSYDNFYPNYKFVYYLTVKDADAYQKIVDAALADEEGAYKIGNSAEWNENSDDSEIDYGYPGLKKELLTPESELKKENEDIWAEFKITANPGAQTLNEGKPIILTDTAEHMDVDITSIRINGEESWPGVSFDQTGNTMKYIIPDATKIVITYRARVEFTTIGDKGEIVHVEFNNKAEMLGYDDSVKKEAYRNNSGGGIASIPQINLLKHEAGDISKKLEGAEFALLDANGKPVLDKDDKPVTYVTGADGMVTVRGNMEELGWALEENTLYILRETKAPKAYGVAQFDYEFKVSADGTSDHASKIYHSGDTLSAKNYRVTGLDVEKVWSDGSDKHEADNITVQLQQKIGDGDWSDTVRMLNEGSDEPWEDLDSVTAILSKDNDWKYSFTNLPTAVPDGEDFDGSDSPAEYRILETEMNGQVPEQNIDGAKYKETTYETTEGDEETPTKVVITNYYVPDTEILLEGQKKFEHGELNEKTFFTFRVSEAVTDEAGNETLTQISEVSTKAPKDSTNPAADSASGKIYFEPITYTLDDLKKDDGTYADKKVFTYVIQENVPASANEKGYDSKTRITYDKTIKRVTVTLTLEGTELIAKVDYGQDGGIVFTNELTPPPPETGDSTNWFVFAAMMFAGLLGTIATIIFRRKRT